MQRRGHESTPTGAADRTATAEAEETAEDTPEATAEETEDGGVTIGGAADLEDLLPDEAAGAQLQKVSADGEDAAALNSEQLSRLLEDLGASPEDLSVAFATDPGGSIVIMATRVEGVAAEETLDTFLGQFQGLNLEERTVGGKSVLAATPFYFYAMGDVMVQVTAVREEVAADALSQLP